MKHIKTGSKVWGHSPLPPFYLEDAYDGLVQLLNNHDLLGKYYFNHNQVVYDQNHYFGLGPKPKPKLADTFGQYRN